MIAEIFSTGNEILSGAIVDTNSAHIAETLTMAGVHVARQICVGDDLDTLVNTIREISGRADIAIVTGGLGPTADDLTAEAMAAAAGVSIELDKDADASIDAYFAMRKWHRNPMDKKQAMLPQGSVFIKNPVGTAPGFAIQISRCRFFCIPGVPSEMKRMLSDAILPELERLNEKDRTIRLVKSVSLFGLPESEVGRRMAGVEDQIPGIEIGFRAKFPEIHIRIYAEGRDKETVAQKIAQAADMVHQRMGEHVFSVTEETLAGAVGRMLLERKETLAVAESCTGGLIANWLTDVPGSSGYFLFSGVTYANAAKVNVLGVSQDSLNQYGAVHETIVREMAAGVRDITGATYGLATSGIAGPDGGTEDKPVGTVCIGLATPTDVHARRLYFSFGSRDRNKTIFAMSALEILRRELTKG